MGRKQKVQKVNKNQKKLQYRRISQPCENFAMLGIFTKLRKWQEFSLGLRIFATLAKMTASLFLASATSRLCSDDLLSTLFLH